MGLSSRSKCQEGMGEKCFSMVCQNPDNPWHSDRKFPERLDLPNDAKSFKPSIEKPPKLKIKSLPTHIKHSYLKEDETLPAIVSSSLTLEQKEKLLEVVKTFKQAKELEHKAYRDLKKLNLDPTLPKEAKFLQLNGLEEFMKEVYEFSEVEKEKSKTWLDSKLVKKKFQVGQLVLLDNSKLRLFPRKLESRWSGPYKINKIQSQGAMELLHPDTGNSFLVNEQRVKPYLASNYLDDEKGHCSHAMFLKDL